MQLEEGSKLKRFGAPTNWKAWTSRTGGTCRGFQPCCCIHDILDADQTALIPDRFVNQGFGMRDKPPATVP